MFKRLLAAALCAVLLLGASGCASKIQPLAAVSYPNAIGFDDYDARSDLREANPIDPDFTAAVDQFACQSAQTLLALASDEQNLCYSPISLYFALALTACAAGGQSQQQLLDILGMPSADILASQCGNLFRLLYEDNTITKLHLASSLWLDRDVTFYDTFVQTAANDFYAACFPVSFDDPATGEAMGQWVSEQTGALLGDAPLQTSPEQIMSLIQTVYYSDQWINRFDHAETRADTFYAPSGEVTAQFMNQSFSSAGFSVGEGFTRASLSLKDGSICFVLPDPGVSLSQLCADEDAIHTLLTGGQSQCGEVIWSIPKFSFSSKLDMGPVLGMLGVSDVFNPASADFSALSDQPAYLSSVIQETSFSINEEGVEAAAFTQIDYDGAAMPEGRAEMILNRPFLYAVYSGGTLLFLGVCVDPTAA